MSLALLLNRNRFCNGGCTLFINGHLTDNGTADLFIRGYIEQAIAASFTSQLGINRARLANIDLGLSQKAANAVSLFINGATPGTNGQFKNLSLFTENFSSITGVATLFTRGYNPQDTFFPVTSQLGIPNSFPANTTFGRYSAYSLFNKVATLYIKGTTPPINYDTTSTLFIYNKQAASSGVPLFIDGKINFSSSDTLFIQGAKPSGGIPLFIESYAIADPTKLNLFIYGRPFPAASSNFPLSVLGCTIGTNGLETISSLFTLGVTPSSNAGMYLFTKGPASAFETANMNLYITSSAKNISSNVPLTLYNVMLGKSATFYMRGSGIGDGTLPCNHGMNLYLSRQPTAAAPLFIRGPGDVLASGTSLYVYGANPLQQGITLAMPATKQPISATPILYTSGF